MSAMPFQSWRGADVVRALGGCFDAPRVITYAHIETLYLLAHDVDAREALLQCDAIYCDGIGAQVGAWMMDGTWRPRCTASDFIVDLVSSYRGSAGPVGLVGSTLESASRSAVWLARRSGADVALALPGYAQDPAVAAARIGEAGVRLLVVGMGQPRQEIFSLRVAQLVPGIKVLCVGALFDQLGYRGRAHRAANTLGLEWMLRLAREPRRLAPRYFVHPIRTALLIAEQRAIGRSK